MELKKTYKPVDDIFENTRIANLPILKHFDSENIHTTVDSFRKGEWSLYNIIKIGTFAALGYFSWVYILPVVFVAIGQVLAIAGTIGIIGLLIMMSPVILKAMRRFTRVAHEAVIKHDPFGELEEQRYKMLVNQKNFVVAKGQIQKIKYEMEQEAQNSETNAKALETKILSLKQKASDIKSKLDAAIAAKGDKAKSDDIYVDLNNQYVRTVSDASRLGYKYEQEKNFISKYGSRANAMRKMNQKLSMVENSIAIKLDDFDATVEILKKDYEFAQKSNQATTAAKSAMTFTSGWEVEFAMDVVLSTIASDIAATAGNIKDIDRLTSMYAMDSDELYANLDKLADDIKTGKSVVKSAKDYNADDYVYTQEDRTQSNGIIDIF